MLFSIITVNYNNKTGLENTIKSVINQSYKSIEFIIIDGNSSDGSKEFICKHKDSISYSISEPDNGPYDAMNKGIDRATGDYLLFLNSGDYLVDDLVIEKFVAYKPIEDIVYGDTLIKKDGKFKRIKMPETLNVGIALTHTINHQTIFYNRSLFEDGTRYDCSYKIVADWVFTNNAIINMKCSTRHIDLVIPLYDMNGMSSDKALRIKDRKRYLESNFDSGFLSLLEDYTRLNAKYANLKNNFLIKRLFKLRKTYVELKEKFKHS